MGEGESTEWPDDDTDPFGDAESKQSSSSVRTSDKNLATLKEEAKEETEEETEETEETEEEADESESSSQSVAESMKWKLPVRAAPLLHQFHNEKVTEYPLQQSTNGRKTTSLVIDDELLRIIDSSLDDDGQRRLKVSLSMKREITGFKHQHNELMHKHQLLWVGSFFLGIAFLLSALPVFSFIGGVLVIVGAWFWSLMHLETHHLEFSNSGGTHSHTLHGYGTSRSFFRASMALLGSEMAGLLKNGVLETEALDQLHESLAASPAPAPAPVTMPMPVQQTQTPFEVQSSSETPQQAFVAPTPISSLPAQIPAPPAQLPAPPAQLPAPPAQLPAPPAQLPAPTITVKTAAMPGPPAVLPPPPTPLPMPPAPIPPPQLPLAPLPPLGGHGALPFPTPIGLPVASLPLDAPLPNAPQIAVTASPIVDTLSEKEQSELLNELS